MKALAPVFLLCAALTGCAHFSSTCHDVYAGRLADYQGEFDDICGFDYMQGVRK